MYPKNPKRGIALLFVISLIVLFFLFATTFVAMSSSYMRSTRQRVRTARLNQYKPDFMLDDAMLMILRGVPEGTVHPLNNSTTFASHSLLADQYDGYRNGQGALVDLAISATPQAFYNNSVVAISVNSLTVNNLFPDQMVGRYLTFIDGPCKNLTFPIIDFQPSTTGSLIFILLQPDNQQWVTTPAAWAQINQHRFVVNGRPFDGYVNLNAANQVVIRSNESYDAIENVDLTFTGVVDALTGTPITPSMQNNANLFLARNVPGSNTYPLPEQQIIPSFHRYDGRFAVVANNLFNSIGTNPTYAELRDLAKTSLRPSPIDNPNFTGSNPNWEFFLSGDYSPANPLRYGKRFSPDSPDANERRMHWAQMMSLLANNSGQLANIGLPPHAFMDVDNDGDGIADSLWLDLGLPVQVRPDGTRVKPLVAVLIEDMDGRVNLNTAGTAAQALNPTPVVVGGGIPLPTGQGYGPAEVHLGALGFGAAQLQILLNHKYGINGGPDATGSNLALHPLDHAMRMGAPETRPTAPVSFLAGDAYGTPADLQGQFVVHPIQPTSPTANFYNPTAVVNAFSLAFLPHHQVAAGVAYLPQFVDNPYSFDVFGRDSGSPSVAASVALAGGTYADVLADKDMKLIPEILEYLLRRNDSDRLQLAQNILQLIEDPNRRALTSVNANGQIAGGLLGLLDNAIGRRMVTTESFEVPALPFNVARMFRTRLQQRRLDEGLAFTPAGLATETLQSLGPDVVAGLPFDINRPFGNGRDDDGDLVPDEPGEVNQTYEYAGVSVGLDMNNDGIPSTTPQIEVGMRQVYARQLYTLMLTLFDKYQNQNLATMSLSADPVVQAAYQEAVRFRIAVAQWAVNVVDFRDADSICTPFEFDIDPFNGWDADGDLLTERFDPANNVVYEYRVWGLERPDVLLTETRADHQHRTSPTVAGGPTYRQGHVPNASTFFEVYNPWLVPDDLDQKPPTGLVQPRHQQYNFDTGGEVAIGGYQYPGVNLSRVTPARHPVFRALVVREDSRGLNPDREVNSFDQLMADSAASPDPTLNAADIEKMIFFADPSVWVTDSSSYVPPAAADSATPSSIQIPPAAEVHYPLYAGGATNQYVVPPGFSAVVGSAGPHANADFYTIYGRNLGAWTTNTDLDTGAGHLENRPYIRIVPDQPVEYGQFNANGRPVNQVIRPNSISVPLNRQHGVGYWTNFAITGGAYAVDGSGVPLDAAGNPAVEEIDGYKFAAGGEYAAPFHQSFDSNWASYGYNSGDPDNYNRQIVLQRLANPTLDFDPLTNPYITIDDMDVQVTASGGLGEDPTLAAAGGGTGRYAEQRGEAPGSPQYAFGGTRFPTGDPTTRNLWLRTMNGQWDSADMPITTGQVATDLFSNTANTTFGTTSQTFDNVAMTWLTFNNRPFTSEGELELVPTQSNALLLEHMVWADNRAGEAYQAAETFFNKRVEALAATLPIDNRISTYLPNFFAYQANIPSIMNFPATVGPTPADATSDVYATRSFTKLFEFVDVPSRFVGTKQLLNFSYDVPGGPGLLNFKFNPPYNWLSKRREPGKINVNTIQWEQIWNALMGGATSRYATQTPFRGATSFSVEREGNQRFLKNSTNPLDSDSAADPRELTSLWAPLDNGQPPMFEFDNAAPAYDTQTTPYFRNLGRQRLMNMTTNRSSVFSVRLTVGYFRLEETQVPVPVNPATDFETVGFNYPVLTTIGQEYGIEDGSNKRDRAFYLIDRSIPVGFVPGENLNVEETILLKRYLE